MTGGGQRPKAFAVPHSALSRHSSDSSPNMKTLAAARSAAALRRMLPPMPLLRFRMRSPARGDTSGPTIPWNISWNKYVN